MPTPPFPLSLFNQNLQNKSAYKFDYFMILLLLFGF